MKSEERERCLTSNMLIISLENDNQLNEVGHCFQIPTM